MTAALDRAFAAVVGLSLFGFPIVSAVPVLAGVESRQVTVVYRAIVLALALFFLIAAVRDRRPLASSAAAGCVALLVVVLLARLVWDSTFVRLPMDLNWTDVWMQTLGITLLPAAAFLFKPSGEALRLAGRESVWLAGLAIVSLAAAIAESVADLGKLARLATEVLNPISVGNMGLSAVIVGAAVPLGSTTPRTARLFRVLVVVAGVALVIASGSKGPLIGLLVSTAGLVIFRGSRIDWRSRLVRRAAALLTVLAVVVVGVAVWVSSGGGGAALERILGFAVDPSTAVRLELATGALRQFEESPIFGSAFVEYVHRFYPHNIVLESLMVGGIPGAVTLVVFGAFAARATWRLLDAVPERRWLALLFVQYAIDSLLSGSLYFDPQFWAVALITIGAAPPPVGESRGRVASGQYA